MHEELGPAAPDPEGHEDLPHDVASHVPRLLELSLGPPDLSEEIARLGVGLQDLSDCRSGLGHAPYCCCLGSTWCSVCSGSAGRSLPIGSRQRLGTCASSSSDTPAAEECVRSSSCLASLVSSVPKPGVTCSAGFLQYRCAFGDTRRRDLSCLTFGLDPAPLRRSCTGGHRHSTPKSGSSVLGFRRCPGLIIAYARAFHLAMRSLRTCTALADYDVAGLERQYLALGLPWKVDAAWTWPKQVHINILESAVLCRLYKEVAIAHGPCRFVAFCDSFVALSSLRKGRSSSASLRHAARRASMICLAAGLYPGSMYIGIPRLASCRPTTRHGTTKFLHRCRVWALTSGPIKPSNRTLSGWPLHGFDLPSCCSPTSPSLPLRLLARQTRTLTSVLSSGLAVSTAPLAFLVKGPSFAVAVRSLRSPSSPCPAFLVAPLSVLASLS